MSELEIPYEIALVTRERLAELLDIEEQMKAHKTGKLVSVPAEWLPLVEKMKALQIDITQHKIALALAEKRIAEQEMAHGR